MSLAALAPIDPVSLKCIFELSGYTVVGEDQFNWLLTHKDKSLPITLPKLGDLVPLEILMDTVFTKAGMDLRIFFELKSRVAGVKYPPVN